MKIFVVGATGRMGLEIRKLIEADSKLKFAGGLSRAADPRNGLYSDFKKVKGAIDVVIDFSSLENFSQTLKWCAENKYALVSGTTGLSPSQKKEISAVAKKIPILWAPNTSVGVHWVKKLLTQMKIPMGFDIQVIEYHHNRKKDKPSGTALLLQDALKTQRKNLPEPLAVRGGGIFGIHKIELMAENETITIEHQALGRTLFARGALDAAQWLRGKKPGTYSMEDFISA